MQRVARRRRRAGALRLRHDVVRAQGRVLARRAERDEVATLRLGREARDATRLAALLSSEYNSFPSLYKPLVIDRNRRWLPQVEELLKANDNSMVLVGALHLVGQGGLIELLRKKGYTVTQLE